MVTAVAIVAVRNEAIHVRRCIRDLIRDGIEVIMVDNDSTDGSAELAREFLGHGLLSIRRLAYRGTFSLSDILAFKKTIADTVPHDWVLHVDADEWLRPPKQCKTLIEGIHAADLQGFNCINFLEFVFVPKPGESYEAEDYSSLMRTYYFFAPFYPRLVRAWKRSAGLDNRERAGHVLTGPNTRLFPQDFILRHYIVLSEAHARRKYLARKYAPE